jgi:hypothetical protein
MKTIFIYLALIVAALILASCAPPSALQPCVEVYHSPIVAKSIETVTFTATNCGTRKLDSLELLVNAASVKTCNNVNPNQTCVYTGGPYGTYEGTTVSYFVTGKAGSAMKQLGYYYFAVTDSNYTWSNPTIPARITGTATDKIDFIFHHADDYTIVDSFIDDVEAKILNVYHGQDIVNKQEWMDLFNFYVYTKDAKSNGCGTVNKDTPVDITWRNIDAVLHSANFQDCTSMSPPVHFSAEGSNTKAFLHESGHAVWGLADEYDGCYTYYFEAPVEPNIFDLENTCRTEQTTKTRDPNACWQFTSCQGGWWGIHQLDGTTVMQTGMVGDKWGIEGEERALYVFRNAPPREALEDAIPGVIIVNLVYANGEWQEGSDGVQVLPCEAPTPYLGGSAQAPLVQLVSNESKSVYSENYYLDPRIILWEPPEPGMGPPMAPFNPEGPSYLEEVSIYISLPVVKGAEKFEFFETAGVQLEGGRPTLTIPIGEAIRTYEENPPALEGYNCQQPVYKPDALK